MGKFSLNASVKKIENQWSSILPSKVNKKISKIQRKKKKRTKITDTENDKDQKSQKLF